MRTHLIFAVLAAALCYGCPEPETPVPPRPTNPTNVRTAADRAGNVIDASILSEAGPQLDVGIFPIDASPSRAAR
jgi:hypothetical protein